ASCRENPFIKGFLEGSRLVAHFLLSWGKTGGKNYRTARLRGAKYRLAALPRHALKMAFHCIHQPPVMIGDDQVNSVKSPPHQPPKQLGARPLRLPVPDPDAQRLTMPVLVHTDADQRPVGRHTPVSPDLQLHRIDEHKREPLGP